MEQESDFYPNFQHFHLFGGFQDPTKTRSKQFGLNLIKTLQKEVGLNVFPEFLPTAMILCFCDSICTFYSTADGLGVVEWEIVLSIFWKHI